MTISVGKFISSLANILFMAYYTIRYINTIFCVCQVLVRPEVFLFCFKQGACSFCPVVVGLL